MSAQDCWKARSRLSPLLEDDLERAAAAETRAHLEACAACRDELEMLRRTLGALRSLPELPAPAGILAGVRTRLQPRPWYRQILEWRQWLVGVPIGALATALVVVGVALFQGRHPEMRRLASRPPEPQRSEAPADRTAPPAPAPSAGPAAPPPPPTSTAPAAPAVPPAAKREAASDGGRRVAPAPPSAPAAEAPAPEQRLRDQSQGAGEQGAAQRTAGAGGADELRAVEPASAPAAATPNRFVIPEPEPSSSVDEYPEGRPDTVQGPPYRRPFRVGSLEEAPRAVTSLREQRPGAPRGAGVAPQLRPPPQGALEKAAETDYRSSGVASTVARASRERLAAGSAVPAPAGPLRATCQLLPGGATVESLTRLLRRQGARDVQATALDPEQLREAAERHRARLAIGPRVSRGWTLAAHVPPPALAGALRALTGAAGVRVLELPAPDPSWEDLPGTLELRITALR